MLFIQYNDIYTCHLTRNGMQKYIKYDDINKLHATFNEMSLIVFKM